MILTLPTPDDFSFQEALVYLGRSPQECLHEIRDGKVYKFLRVGTNKVLIEVAPTASKRSIDVRIRFGDWNVRPTVHEVGNDAGKDSAEESLTAQLWMYLAEWFDLDTDLTQFYELARADRMLQPLVQKYHGLRVIGIPDLFEALCWAVIGQQINLPFAYLLKKRFVESFGESMEWQGHRYWSFPSPGEVACLSVERLRELQFTEKKSEYILGVAEQLASGSLSKQQLSDMEDDTAMKTLVKIRGIGPWTASYVLMRCLHRPSAFPISDVGLHNAIKQQLKLERKPTVEEIQNLAAGWSGWEAYATFYLWRSLGDES